MLEVTSGAVALLNEIRREQSVPEEHGLRVFPEMTQPGEVAIGLGFTESPTPGDQVTEKDGLRVFVAQELASPLQDAAIDVTQEGGASQLVFRPQGDDAQQ